MIEIKKPTSTEKPDWLPLWNDYLVFYKTPLTDEVTNKTWERFHDESEPIWVLCAYVDGQMAGFVTMNFHRSTWNVADYCYLEDLFVAENFRGQGVARKLIESVYDYAKKAGASRVYWTTQENNKTAQALYNKVAKLTDFIQYKMPID